MLFKHLFISLQQSNFSGCTIKTFHIIDTLLDPFEHSLDNILMKSKHALAYQKYFHYTMLNSGGWFRLIDKQIYDHISWFS